MRPISNIVVAFVGLAILLGSVATAAELPAAEEPAGHQPEKETPGWEQLTEQAREASMARFSTEELRTQAEKKQDRLDALTDEQAQLEGKLVAILTGSEKVLADIEKIEDPVLRDESLLRYRSARRVQVEALRVRLKSVSDEIQREQRELRTVRQLLHSRRAEARMHGREVKPEGSYREYLAREAARARESEREILRQVSAERLRRLEAAILPHLRPSVPDPASAVLWSNGSPR